MRPERLGSSVDPSTDFPAAFAEQFVHETDSFGYMLVERRSDSLEFDGVAHQTQFLTLAPNEYDAAFVDAKRIPKRTRYANPSARAYFHPDLSGLLRGSSGRRVGLRPGVVDPGS